MSILHEKILAAVTAEAESRTEWDEPAAFYFLHLDGGVPCLREADMAELWTIADPVALLASMARRAEQFAQQLQALAPENLHGLAFRFESWQVHSVRGDDARLSGHAAEARAHRLDRHPERREARSVYAVDRVGITYTRTLFRDGGEPAGGVEYPRPGKLRTTGSVMRSLDGLVQGMLGVAMPERPYPAGLLR